ncbi:hypothetical protein IJG91_01350 [Candidatus Saccharibacteria bacterium]|nr:hypothetical protein [Candidatus Saccharibacteria bacterium]
MKNPRAKRSGIYTAIPLLRLRWITIIPISIVYPIAVKRNLSSGIVPDVRWHIGGYTGEEAILGADRSAPLPMKNQVAVRVRASILH